MNRETTIEYMRKAVAYHNENPADCLGRNCCDCPHDYPVEAIELIESALELLEGKPFDPWDGEKPHAEDGFPEQRWIPCGERLPEKGKEVLVCYDFKGHRSVLIGTLYGDEKFHGYDDEYLTPEGRKYRKAVAWMPLPEPYQGESEVKE